MNIPPTELSEPTMLLDYEMPSRLDEIARLAVAVEGVLPGRADLAFTVNLCLEELITNIIQHGLNGAPGHRIGVRLSADGEWLEIRLQDDAPPYNPFTETPEPDLDLDVDERPVGGLGVHMVRAIMDDTRAYTSSHGNLVVLLKTLHQ